MNKPKKKAVLITGATGFIGRHLVERLLALGEYQIFLVSRQPEKVKNWESRGAKLFKADISKKEDLKKLNKLSLDAIVHCAALVEAKNLKMLNKVNVEGTENICKLAVELGVERLVYLSSVAVVSGNCRVPLVEDLPHKATNRYGESKLEAEKKVLAYRRKGVPVVILRPPMVYGEDEPHAFPVLLKLLRFRLPLLPNKGRAKLHLAYVGNVAEAIIFSLRSPDVLKGAFFVADKEILTVYQVFKNMAGGLKRKAPLRLPDFCTPFFCALPFFGKHLKFFLKNRAYDTAKIKSAGFNPPYKAEESLIKSCQAYSRRK